MRWIITGIVGAVFAIAGIAKAVYPLQASRVVTFVAPWLSGHPPVADAVVAAFAGIEAGLALLLLVMSRRIHILAIMSILLVGFMVLLAYLAVSPGSPNCGCFGVPRMESQREAVAGIVRNAGLLCMIGWLISVEWRGARASREGQPILHARGTGFTLIELIVVMAILSVVIAITIPTLAGAKEQARRSRRLQIGRQLNASLAMYCTDHEERLPYFGTPGKPFGPIRIRGFELRGQYFRTQRWLWASVVLPEYFAAPRDAIETPGRDEYLHNVLQWPECIVASDYQLTSNAFAAPAFWREDSSGGNSWMQLKYLRPTALTEVQFPAEKGLLVADLGGSTDVPAGDVTVVGLGDLSARLVPWRQLDWDRAVTRPWGAAGYPIESTLGGLAGRDF